LESESPSQLPSTIPSQSPSDDACKISNERMIGKKTTNEFIVTYRYKMNYRNEFRWDTVVKVLETNIITFLVKESGYTNCGLQKDGLVERSMVVGVSSLPNDVVTGKIHLFVSLVRVD
jgi:hypothetical protein